MSKDNEDVVDFVKVNQDIVDFVKEKWHSKVEYTRKGPPKYVTKGPPGKYGTQKYTIQMERTSDTGNKKDIYIGRVEDGDFAASLAAYIQTVRDQIPKYYVDKKGHDKKIKALLQQAYDDRLYDRLVDDDDAEDEEEDSDDDADKEEADATSGNVTAKKRKILPVPKSSAQLMSIEMRMFGEAYKDKAKDMSWKARIENLEDELGLPKPRKMNMKQRVLRINAEVIREW